MIRLILLFFSVSLLVSIESTAQSTLINYGTNLTASINSAGEHHEYSFTGQSGDRILLRMKGTKDGVDGCFYLYAPDGTLLAGDCSDGRLVTINNFALPVNGTYTLKVQDHNDNDSGIYGLSLQVLNRVDHATSYDCSTPYEMDLEHLAEVDAYAIEAGSGDVVIMQMRGILGNIEPILELYNEQGELIRRAEPFAGLSRIGAVRLEEAGNYLLLAYDENGNDLGDYHVGIQLLNNNSCALPAACGADFSAALDVEAEIDAYTFEATAGDVMVAHMRGNDNHIEPLMELYGPDGDLIGVNDNVGKLGKFPATTLNKSGKYVLLAMDQAGNDKGTYSMSLQFTNSQTDCTVPLHCSNTGKTWELSGDAEIDAFSFYATAGESVSIQVSEVDQNLEPRFELYAPDGNLLITASNGDIASKDNILLPDEGNYTLLVMDYEGNDEGQYTLEIDNNGGDMIQDIIPPVVHCKELTIALEIGGTAEISPEDLDDGSEDDCGIVSKELSKTVFGCEDIGIQLVTLTITDGGGNIGICEILVTVIDPDLNCGWNFCESVANSTAYEWIKEVNFGTIRNLSGNDGGYGDYTHMSTEVHLNSSNVIEFSPGLVYSSDPLRECWGVWIDLNDDGDFEDAGEQVLQKSSYGTIFGTINIPANAVIGEVRMRISMNYEAYPTPCGEFEYGETEDYTIRLLPDAFCGNLPDGWNNSDVGLPVLSGSSCYQSSTQSFVLSAASGTISKKADQFQFAYKEFCGDGEIIARIVGMQSDAAGALSGIMMRESLAEGSINVSLMASLEDGIFFNYREKTDKKTKDKKIDLEAPVWMKLVREGHSITAYLSEAGLEWTAYYSVSIEGLDDCLLFGLAVSSNNIALYNRATFENVRVQIMGLTEDGNEEHFRSEEEEELAVKITDKGPEAGADRLPERDNDSEIELSDIAENRDAGAEETGAEIVIYPNPAVEYARIEFSELWEGTKEVFIYTVQGRLIWQQRVEGSDLQIDLRDSGFLSGQYWVRIKTPGKEISRPLLIVR